MGGDNPYTRKVISKLSIVAPNINNRKIFANRDAMVSHITKKEYSSAGQPEVCFGFSLEKLGSKNFNYSLHFFTADGRGGRQSIPDTLDASSNPFQKNPDLVSYNLWINSGYLLLMKVINEVILEDITNSNTAKLDFGVLAQNYTTFKANTQGGIFAGIMPFFIIIGYLIPLTSLIYRIVKEKV